HFQSAPFTGPLHPQLQQQQQQQQQRQQQQQQQHDLMVKRKDQLILNACNPDAIKTVDDEERFIASRGQIVCSEPFNIFVIVILK
ncbi:unnamed protein product, partial [Gongylonema pulchrum]|uniref:Uncharacterized protein n=1 Tax=Gongylonema pulchrum TaxID=637853 RepID=A0A183EPB7_9BILA